MSGKPTLKDVARCAGVSPITVSRYVNTPDKVSSSARIKIEKALVQIGYIPNEAARQLKTSQSKIVFFLVPNIRNELYSYLSHQLTIRLSQEGRSLFICDYNFDEQIQDMQLLEVIKQRPMAIIIAAEDHISPTRISQLNVSNIPIIQFDKIHPDINSLIDVSIDNYQGGFLAGKYFFEREIEHVTIFSANSDLVVKTRIAGIESFLDKNNISFDVINLDLNNVNNFEVNIDKNVGYFLLNSDIANIFFSNLLEKYHKEVSDRVVIFDRPTHPSLYALNCPTIAYDKESIYRVIIDGVTKIDLNGLNKTNSNIIPVHLSLPSEL